MGDTIEIKIKNLINPSLEMNSATSIFFEKPNKISEDKIKIDFKDKVFMSCSFLKSILNKKN
jgi:hypothetical protein